MYDLAKSSENQRNGTLASAPARLTADDTAGDLAMPTASNNAATVKTSSSDPNCPITCMPMLRPLLLLFLLLLSGAAGRPPPPPPLLLLLVVLLPSSPWRSGMLMAG